ncbi:alpha-tocopherol transfer protein-like [Polyergus mexicanus]|uniref:alpha-tocopherol transfer protein-like n=1 Tax=Polyergus mexicanus TaxID=615972 RepID=UPI0038B509A9
MGRKSDASVWNSDESREVKRLMGFYEFEVFRGKSAFYIDVSRVQMCAKMLPLIFIREKYICMIIETRLEEYIVNSDVFIYNCTNLTLGHILKYTLPVLKKIDTILEAYGTRIKAIYIINAPSFIDVLITMSKSVMKAKLIKRVNVYTFGTESLYGIIPRSILPMDYSEFFQVYVTSKIDGTRRGWFLEQEKVKVDESLRSNSVINPYDLFGVPGTLQKLNID